MKRKEAKKKKHIERKMYSGLLNLKYLVVLKKINTIKALNYAAFEIVLISYSLLIFEHTHTSSMLLMLVKF